MPVAVLPASKIPKVAGMWRLENGGNICLKRMIF